MENKDGTIRFLKDVKVKPKENNVETVALTGKDVEILNANLQSLEQKIDRLPEYINDGISHSLQENPCFKSLQSIKSLLERINSNLEDIERYININDAKEVSKQLVILRNILNILPNDLHNFIGRKFDFLFTLPLWWLKTEKVKSFCKQMGVILLSLFTAILLFLVIYLANDNRHQRLENYLLRQTELKYLTEHN